MYDSISGRFLGRDPYTYVDGLHLYASYFAISNVDPRGLCVPAKCKVASGPTFTPNGELIPIAQEIDVAFGPGGMQKVLHSVAPKFTQEAAFVNDPANGFLPQCCVVSQNIKIGDQPWEEDLSLIHI